jgi:hypothetical protein
MEPFFDEPEPFTKITTSYRPTQITTKKYDVRDAKF